MLLSFLKRLLYLRFNFMFVLNYDIFYVLTGAQFSCSVVSVEFLNNFVIVIIHPLIFVVNLFDNRAFALLRSFHD